MINPQRGKGQTLKKAAIISKCGAYRYVLLRGWDLSKPTVVFVCLNPSTADAQNDDPTLRRCIGFARDWNFGQVAIVNLFAYRATNPKALLEVDDPVGPDNDYWLDKMAEGKKLFVAAWGNKGMLLNRDMFVEPLLPNMQCLGITKTGQPRHPLYIRADTKLQPYPPRNGGPDIRRSNGGVG